MDRSLPGEPSSDEPLLERGRAVGPGGSGKVESLVDEDSRRIEASLGPLPPPVSNPALVVTVGLPGSGKSYFTRRLQERSPLVRLESDALRRLLFGRPAYSREESARLFTTCHRVIDRLLASGRSVVLDATNLREVHRRHLYAIARRRGARLFLVRLRAPVAVVRRRLEHRTQTPGLSEAGYEVYLRMRRQAEPLRHPHITVDTAADIEPALDALVQALGGHPESRSI